MMNRRRTAKLNLKLDRMGRAFGHSFGVLGAIMGLNAIATSIDPQFLQLFPLRDIGIQQTSAALLSVGLIALAAWLVTQRHPPATPKIDPPEAP